MSGADAGRPAAIVFGCAGESLTPDEAAFFADIRPAGFILFGYNVSNPDQVRALVDSMRGCVSGYTPMVLIDQEGGKVARLGPPYWNKRPPAKIFADLAATDSKGAHEAARINARLMAHDLTALGIDVDCAPVVDVPIQGAHDIIGDRAHGQTPELVASLGRAVCEGLLEGGVAPMIKHMPGHGRARADSHKELPRVDTARAVLHDTDFHPFTALNDMPCAMSAHVMFTDIDAEQPATTSRKMIDDVIRGEIGFGGLLFSDDLGMEALSGTLPERAAAVLAAGCDIALECWGDLEKMRAVAPGVPPMSDAAMARYDRMRDAIGAPNDADIPSLEARLTELIGPQD
ncbi:MAG: beta-N-acetylhexosaminidase [Rhodospirillales bacterium]|nr:beta-N-acetylhexosaminidase [Rhodospirillales bacterium]